MKIIRQPALGVIQPEGEYLAEVGSVFRFMVFHYNFAVHIAEQLDLSGDMRHAVFKALAEAVLHGLCALDYLYAVSDRYLEAILHAGHRTALEHIIRRDRGRCELAHQLGVYAEDEANFVGILACTQSDNDIYAYSGYFSGTIHLLNALYEVDRDACDTITSNFSDELKHDWNYNNSYWADMESSVSEAASEVYDEYLKSNGQELGIASYSNCVMLLVNYFMSAV